MKVALDTNILAYAEGTNGVEMRDKALNLVQKLPGGSVVLPTQGTRRTVQRPGLEGEEACGERSQRHSWLAGCLPVE